jgi:transposase
MSRRGRYPKEFKTEAVKLLNEGKRPASEVAMQLGVKRTLLYRWRDELNEKGEKAFSGRPGRPKNESLSEVTRLRQELASVKEERDILKKAAAYFARDLK